jgi:hypothetical protein
VCLSRGVGTSETAEAKAEQHATDVDGKSLGVFCALADLYLS